MKRVARKTDKIKRVITNKNKNKGKAKKSNAPCKTFENLI